MQVLRTSKSRFSPLCKGWSDYLSSSCNFSRNFLAESSCGNHKFQSFTLLSLRKQCKFSKVVKERDLTIRFGMERSTHSSSQDIENLLSSTPTVGGTLQRAIQVARFAGPRKFLENTFIVSNKPKPKPVSGEVVVRMKLRPLNPADGLSLMGLYSGFQPIKFPATPGLEGMGIIDAVSTGVTHLKVFETFFPRSSLPEYQLTKLINECGICSGRAKGSSQFAELCLSGRGLLAGVLQNFSRRCHSNPRHHFR